MLLEWGLQPLKFKATPNPLRRDETNVKIVAGSAVELPAHGESIQTRHHWAAKDRLRVMVIGGVNGTNPMNGSEAHTRTNKFTL